jgi:hypothetical protein
MLDVIMSMLYFPSIWLNMIGLLLAFVIILNWKARGLIAAAENVVFSRYSAITRRIHLPKHRTPREFTPSISFMGGKCTLCAAICM